MPDEMRRYACGGCHYIYDPSIGDPAAGIPPGTPFSALPAHWACPECGAPRDMFSPLDQ